VCGRIPSLPLSCTPRRSFSQYSIARVPLGSNNAAAYTAACCECTSCCGYDTRPSSSEALVLRSSCRARRAWSREFCATPASTRCCMGHVARRTALSLIDSKAQRGLCDASASMSNGPKKCTPVATVGDKTSLGAARRRPQSREPLEDQCAPRTRSSFLNRSNERQALKRPTAQERHGSSVRAPNRTVARYALHLPSNGSHSTTRRPGTRPLVRGLSTPARGRPAARIGGLSVEDSKRGGGVSEKRGDRCVGPSRTCVFPERRAEWHVCATTCAEA